MGKKREREENEGLNIDLGTGALGLGGLFKGIERLVDLAADLKEAGGEIRKEGQIDLGQLKEGVKGVFGFSLRTAAGGKPVVEPFGNIRKTPRGPTIEEEREPITDVFDEKEAIRVYAEMPGVDEEDIRISLKDDILEISAKRGERKYRKEILLPIKTTREALTSKFKNGILEITLRRQGR